MSRYLAGLLAFALGKGCSAFRDAHRQINQFHEVGSFHAPNMHALYPTSTHFVVAPESVMVDRNVVIAYSRRACGDPDEQVCFVFFWTKESKAARGFPLSDDQADAIVASYNRNRSTGNDGLQCYDFGLPREHCKVR